MQLVERTVTCPYCWEAIALQIDLSAGGQEYVEDCSVCCRPLQISYTVWLDQLADLQVDGSA